MTCSHTGYIVPLQCFPKESFDPGGGGGGAKRKKKKEKLKRKQWKQNKDGTVLGRGG